ncbi:unnamed protein product [Cylindrotheca closterium]|uniref:Uncharacterized protein n=1 Tax=Cylindrotheca closterium TaxID=2856 RepID=A0AAD2G7Q0_9STRA|nr:unnamed protein product [Cylindrotheca closterium]
MTSSFVTQAFQRPRAVVLVLGFAGAKPKHVAKYANVYHSLNCSTVAGTATNRDIFTGNTVNQDAFALEGLKLVTKLLKEVAEADDDNNQANKTPVVMHILSNGGTFITNRIGIMLEANDNSVNKKEETTEEQDNDTETSQDLRLFGDRLKLGCQIFDSAPGFFTTSGTFNVIRSLVPNKIIGYPAAAMYVVFTHVLNLSSYLMGQPTHNEEFWSRLQTDTNCLRQAYMYSNDDEIVEGKYIEELANDRKAGVGEYVALKHFENSAHVQHLRKHEEEYVSFVKTTLEEVEKLNR